jgi:hypothetical protein
VAASLLCPNRRARRRNLYYVTFGASSAQHLRTRPENHSLETKHLRLRLKLARPLKWRHTPLITKVSWFVTALPARLRCNGHGKDARNETVSMFSS